MVSQQTTAGFVALQVVLAALLLGFAAFTTSLRGMFLIVSKVALMVALMVTLVVEDIDVLWMYYGC